MFSEVYWNLPNTLESLYKYYWLNKPDILKNIWKEKTRTLYVFIL